MSSIEAGAVATTALGVIWAVLAVISGDDHADTVHNAILGAVIAAAGLATVIGARWWENR
jgi:flagellar motor component MotA